MSIRSSYFLKVALGVTRKIGDIRVVPLDPGITMIDFEQFLKFKKKKNKLNRKKNHYTYRNPHKLLTFLQ